MNPKEHDIELIFLDLSILNYDKKNPNKMTEAQMEGLVKSVKENKMIQPIIVQRHELDSNGKVIKEFKNLIANGEHRAEACEKAGFKTIPAFYFDMTEAQRILYRQVGNKLSGSHDMELDSVEFAKMRKLGIEDIFKDMTSMSDAEFDKIIRWGKEVAESNESIDVNFEVTHKCSYPGCTHGKK